MSTVTEVATALTGAEDAARLRRWLWFGIAAVAFGGVIVAVVLQHVADLDPCPLCILQRWGHLGVGVFALGAALTSRRVVSTVLGLGAVASGLAGGAVASHQVWMQQNPLTARCSLQTFRLVNDSLPAQWMPGLFRGAGDCLANDWSMFGLTMPAWSLVLFCAMLIAAWPALVLPRR